MKQKGKQPVQGIKREEPRSKGKEVVRSQVVKSPITISNSKPGNFVAKSEVWFPLFSFFPIWDLKYDVV